VLAAKHEVGKTVSILTTRKWQAVNVQGRKAACSQQQAKPQVSALEFLYPP
jgi:hypothetical protein